MASRESIRPWQDKETLQWANGKFETNYGEAKKSLRSQGYRHENGIYEPVERAERGEMVLEPGDRLCYTTDSAFPGLSGHRQGRVKFLYRKPGLKTEWEYAALLDREWDVISESRWVGKRDAEDGPAPTPGLRDYGHPKR